MDNLFLKFRMTNDTTRDAFEAWAKTNHLDITQYQDAWGRYNYNASDVDSMWFGWQAATEQGKRLTDEQIDDLAKIHGDYSASHGGNYSMNADGRWSVLTFARAIEAAITATPQGGM